MMGVQRREGGNAVEWSWKDEGITKVCCNISRSQYFDFADNQLRRRVYKGIPDRWRMAAWWTLAEVRAEEESRKAKGKRKADDLQMDYRVSHISM